MSERRLGKHQQRVYDKLAEIWDMGVPELREAAVHIARGECVVEVADNGDIVVTPTTTAPTERGGGDE